MANWYDNVYNNKNIITRVINIYIALFFEITVLHINMK